MLPDDEKEAAWLFLRVVTYESWEEAMTGKKEYHKIAGVHFKVQRKLF